MFGPKHKARKLYVNLNRIEDMPPSFPNVHPVENGYPKQVSPDSGNESLPSNEEMIPGSFSHAKTPTPNCIEDFAPEMSTLVDDADDDLMDLSETAGMANLSINSFGVISDSRFTFGTEFSISNSPINCYHNPKKRRLD